MTSVFRNLNEHVNNFSSKKKMPRDFGDKLKKLLDIAEYKLKKNYKPTKDELLAFTKAYRIFFIVTGTKPTKIHVITKLMDKKLLNVNKEKAKKSVKKTLSISKSLSKKKQKGSKALLEGHLKKKVMKGGVLGLDIPISNTLPVILSSLARYIKNRSIDNRTYLELINYDTRDGTSWNCYRKTGDFNENDYYILGKKDGSGEGEIHHIPTNHIPTLHFQIGPQNAHCTDRKYKDSPFVFFSIRAGRYNTNDGMWQYVSTKPNPPEELNAPPERNIFFNKPFDGRINTYKKMVSRLPTQSYQNNVLIHNSYLLTKDELYHISNYSWQWDIMVNCMLYNPRFFVSHAEGNTRRNYEYWWQGGAQHMYYGIIPSTPSPTINGAQVYEPIRTNRLREGPHDDGHWNNPAHTGPSVRQILIKKRNIWDRIFYCKANVTVKKPGGRNGYVVRKLSDGRVRETCTFLRIAGSDCGNAPRREPDGTITNVFNPSRKFVSTIYGNDYRGFSRGLVNSICNPPGGQRYGSTEDSPLRVFNITTLPGVPYISFDNDPFFSIFEENEILFNRGVIFRATSLWQPTRQLLNTDEFGSLGGKFVRVLNVELLPDPGSLMLMDIMRNNSASVRDGNTIGGLIPDDFKIIENNHLIGIKVPSMVIDSIIDIENTGAMPIDRERARELKRNNMIPFPLPAELQIPAARDPVHLSGINRIDRGNSYNGAYFREYSGIDDTPPAPTDIRFKAKWGSKNGLHSRSNVPNVAERHRLLNRLITDGEYNVNNTYNRLGDPRLVATNVNVESVNSYIKGMLSNQGDRTRIQQHIDAEVAAEAATEAALLAAHPPAPAQPAPAHPAPAPAPAPAHPAAHLPAAAQPAAHLPAAHFPAAQAAQAAPAAPAAQAAPAAPQPAQHLSQVQAQGIKVN